MWPGVLYFVRYNHWHGSPWHYEVDGVNHIVAETTSLNANLPQVLPEPFFSAHPELRGPRVDQVNRFRTPRFAPCVDQPQTLGLYREAMQNLLARCPEVEVFNFLTTDSGSGFCWVPVSFSGEGRRTGRRPHRYTGDAHV